MMVPMYQAEAAPPSIRGAVVSFYQLSITLGILTAQLIDLGTEKIHSSASWRFPIGLQLLWGAMLIVGTLFVVSLRPFRGVFESRALLRRPCRRKTKLMRSPTPSPSPNLRATSSRTATPRRGVTRSLACADN